VNIGIVNETPLPPPVIDVVCVRFNPLNLIEHLLAGYMPLASNLKLELKLSESMNVCAITSDLVAVFWSDSDLLPLKSTPSPEVCVKLLELVEKPPEKVSLILIARVVATRITSLC